MDGWNFEAFIWIKTVTRNMNAKIAVPIRYPTPKDIDTASPPVSPKVVAAILIIQNNKVISGTFANDFSKLSCKELYHFRIAYSDQVIARGKFKVQVYKFNNEKQRRSTFMANQKTQN